MRIDLAIKHPLSTKFKQLLQCVQKFLSIVILGMTFSAPVGHSTSHAPQWIQYVVLYKVFLNLDRDITSLPTLSILTRIFSLSSFFSISKLKISMPIFISPIILFP